MELKQVVRTTDSIEFQFDEGGHIIPILVPDEGKKFGYLGLGTAFVDERTPQEMDKELQERDVVLAFFGKDRVLSAAAQIVGTLLDEQEIPLYITLQERHAQRMLTILTSHIFFDTTVLKNEVADILCLVRDQIKPVPQETVTEAPDDPLDRIGEDDSLSIYIEPEEGYEEQDLIPASEVTDA